MTIYLPIAELSVNIFIILGMGAAVGFLSGMFGVGGGFLITPLLIFYNIPPVVAVARNSHFLGLFADFDRLRLARAREKSPGDMAIGAFRA